MATATAGVSWIGSEEKVGTMRKEQHRGSDFRAVLTGGKKRFRERESNHVQQGVEIKVLYNPSFGRCGEVRPPAYDSM